MNRLVLIILCILPFWSYSQLQVTGTVNDAQKTPIPGANVILISPEGKMISGTITNSNGTFRLKANPGTYQMKISFLGFINLEKKLVLDTNTDLGTLLLKEDKSNLKEVSIKGKQKLVTYRADRIIFDVENSISATGGNAVNAISSAPGIIVQNNTISMLGKGSSHVMVDGRMIELSGEDLISYLNSISSSEIKSIEVISNPPAQYEAAGDGGLINIILKKGVKDSWSNASALTYTQNKYGFSTLSDNFLYRKNRLKLALSSSAGLGNSRIQQSLDTEYPNGPWELKYDGKQKMDNASGRAGLDYELSKQTIIGFQYLGNYNNSGSADHTGINIFNQNHTLDSLLTNKGTRSLIKVSHTFNVHGVSNLDTLGRKVSFDADYFTLQSKTDNDFIASTFLPDGQFLHTNLAARNISNQDIDNFSVKADLEHPLKFINLSYGAKVSFIRSQANITYFNTTTGTPVEDLNQSDAFRYEEKNQAVYFSGTKKIGDKLSLQLGLRLEDTETNGQSVTLAQTSRNNYLKLFPTFYTSYRENDDHSFLFNYGRRINRPDFGVLNPFRSYLNSNSYSEGNPFLRPSFSDNFEFTHTYKGKLRSNIFLNLTNDGFGPVFTSNPLNNTLIVSRQNYFRELYYGIGEDYTVTITSWWQNQDLLYLMNAKSKFTNSINATPGSSPQWYASTNNTFSLSGSTKLEADYYYSSSHQRGLYQFGYSSGLNIGVKQSLMQQKMQVSLLVNDLFNTAYLRNYTSVVNGIKQVYNENNSSRFFRLSLSYNFGNTAIKIKQRDFGNDEERNRTN